jgi:chromosome segregation protein
MRLESVEIVGFKSFCDKQEISFKGGITGVVGPNGCGKSNISDAINWVLGEQSAKSLRGTSMEDVIFNGSSARQPLQMAEVNLKVSGLNGNSPDGSPECVVTRRLYRSGESEYLMNGQVCRLRDIHELFMDTGLGSKAYSIIEQGKIGQILSSKPADRRALVEEAAGITKYKARRRQTQLKLEAAQQNLLRVNDIIHEVEKQLESLKRQASKARRYRVLREQVQGVLRVVYGRRFLDLRAQLDSLRERLAAERGREQAAHLALQTEEAQMEARRVTLYEEEARLEDARSRLGELTLTVDRLENQAGYDKQQIAEAETRAEEAGREAQELQERVAPLFETLEARRGDEGSLRDELVAAEDEAKAAEAALASSCGQKDDAEARQEQARDAQVGLMGRIAALQNARGSVTGSAERAQADLLKLASEWEELQRERGAALEAREAAEGRRRAVEGSLASLRAEHEAAAARAAEARGRAEALGREAEALQSEVSSLRGRLASLQEIIETHSAFDEGVRALLERPAGIEVLGVAADALEADSAYERAVEAFLGDRLQAVLVPDADRALRGIRHLQESGGGRAAFLPIASAGVRSDEAPLRALAAREPRVLGLLSDFYRVTGPHAEGIRASLEEALVFQSLDDALEVIAREGPKPAVTLAGEVARGALLEGGRGGKGLLTPRREAREAAERQAALRVELERVRGRGAEEAASEKAAEAEARGLTERIHALEKDRVAIDHDLAVALEAQKRLERKASVLETERRQAEQDKGAAAVKLAEIDHALEQAEAERAAAHERLQALATEVQESRAATEVAQARSAEAKSHRAALRERAAAAEAELRRLEGEHEELLARIAAAASRREEMLRRREQLVEELARGEGLLAEALVERDRATAEVARAEGRVHELRTELDSREQALKERRREREMLRDALSELEVTEARAESDLDHLARECHQAVGKTAAEAAALLTDEDKAREMAALEEQVKELQDRIERMGQVNVLAVEQAQELDERHTFLVAQRQDLLDSIAELERAIRTIDRTSRERFQEAFQVINERFGEVFKQLFGGGTAGLSLLDEEDLLESGIDIMAQPPGKRLQNVMLLSGGEKALTAIALLFAIFQYKPSPFCILDEVDAPLDDANIARFAKMLEGMKDNTQFVLITHSRKTMEIADQLYGVTMEEPGVSKLVSVRFT